MMGRPYRGGSREGGGGGIVWWMVSRIQILRRLEDAGFEREQAEALLESLSGGLRDSRVPPRSQPIPPGSEIPYTDPLPAETEFLRAPERRDRQRGWAQGHPKPRQRPFGEGDEGALHTAA